eukprot:839551-Amphidinium_carterae.1
MLELGPDDFKSELFEKLARVRKYAKNLRQQNDFYVVAMPLEIKEVVACKHLSLFEHLSRLSGINDPELVDGLRKFQLERFGETDRKVEGRVAAGYFVGG